MDTQELLVVLRERLLPLLRCLLCHGLLDLKKGPGSSKLIDFEGQYHLRCQGCGMTYPITEDLIPVFLKDGAEAVPRDPRAALNRAANIAVYDATSTEYDQYARRKPALRTRIENAFKRAREKGKVFGQTQVEPGVHLDYGCGPGHVLGWLKSFGYLQIGMDLSLENLRKARLASGCVAICADACEMPFADESIDLVTESSALHHIFEWKVAVGESLRICKRGGGIVIDAEPTKEQMAWSPLAVAVFNARFPIYRVLSVFLKGKYMFRDTAQAKENLLAEIHHQPGTGFPLEELIGLFNRANVDVEVVVSPTPELSSRAAPDWKNIILNVLSVRNPWNPKYGAFTAIGVRR
jgi:ubiquinone/menaquinone biosynthesis C-methylase UbiE/uncharacterized protein YbaR (Trm112 family)